MLVRHRREELKLSIRTAASEAGLSINTWRRLEQAMAIRSHNFAKIEKALSWAHGSIRDFLGEGRTPIVVGPALPGVQVATLPDDAVEASVAKAIIAVADGVTAKQIRDISELVLDDLRRKGLLDAD